MNLSSLQGKRVTITGGAGFIGHNLGLALTKHGAKVDIIDSLQVNNLYTFMNDDNKSANRDLYIKIINQRLELLRKNNITLHLQDIRDYHALGHLLSSIKPEILIHLAAVSHANKSNKDPYSTFDHSFRTLENALDTVRKSIKHFIFFSSSMVYGHFDDGAVTEDTVCNPLGIYGALKYSGEKLVIAYHQTFDLPYTIIRPSALYGERCVSRRVGQIFLENAVQGKDITVHGDGEDKLDFTYIQDLIQGVIRTIITPEALNQIFNITYGQGRKITDMAKIVQESFPHVQISYLPKDSLTPDRGTLSIEKARKILDYKPDYPLEKGYREYIAWYKKIMNR
jgi:nucleoside-diphosphate-sugar epimerase